MAKGSIGSVEPADVQRINALKANLGFDNAGQAVALLLDEYESLYGSVTGDDVARLDDGEVAGLEEAKRVNARMMREIERLLVRRHELQAEAVGKQAKQVEELSERLAERDEAISERDARIEAMAAELEDLRVKAAGVDALAEQLRAQAEEAARAREQQVEQLGRLIERIDKEAERHEAVVADLRARLDAVMGERDALAAQVRESGGSAV